MKHAVIPMRSVGPVRIESDYVAGEVSVPLATFETPLWPSVNRGAKVSREAGGIRVVLLDDRMSRSVIVEGGSAAEVAAVATEIAGRRVEIDQIVGESSRFARLMALHTQIVGRLLYIRLECSTGEAAGHNMVTKAADRLMQWVLTEYPQLHYVSISGNFCCDKKVSAVNGILGRGKSVVAEMTVPRSLCETLLHTTPEKIVALNTKKNLVGSIVAGSLRTANAHFANMLLAIYLATGQDAANIIEGSQGLTFADVGDDQLYFSVTLPNIIVGTVGNGKEHPFVQENLEQLGCLNSENGAKRLAVITAATVLCGEISLLAAQTNPGELMHAHEVLERRG